ncbi:MAG: formate--tetrahydrofolate ligase, partial [Negativicutes bacterium]
CNSIMASKLALSLADYAVTEAGFGSELGAEKFIDIKCRRAGIAPDAAVLVSTIRSLKYNGGADKENIASPDLAALQKGIVNLGGHIEILQNFGLNPVVALNRFSFDSDGEIAFVRDYCKQRGVQMAICENFAKGGEGALELAHLVVDECERAQELKFAYALSDDTAALPAMEKGDPVRYGGGKLAEKQTKPPSRFTPATLLAAMKDIHKYVKDAEAKKRLRAVSGIGTEATRAAIIEDLIRRRFLKAQGKKKQLVPQNVAELLVDALPDEMTYPDKTAVWEDELASMAAGEGGMERFLAQQAAFAGELCEAALGVKMAAGGEYRCPRCHQGALTRRHGKNGDFWGCTNFPRCRLTCNDKNGKPDLTAAQCYTSVAEETRSENESRLAPEKSAAASPGDFLPLSEEEMAAFTATYRPELSAQSFLARTASPPRSWTEKPKRPAAALEHTPADVPESAPLCPRCRAGRLHLVHGRNGDFWGCSNYPRCTATYDDQQGQPLV